MQQVDVVSASGARVPVVGLPGLCAVWSSEATDRLEAINAACLQVFVEGVTGQDADVAFIAAGQITHALIHLKGEAESARRAHRRAA